MSDLQKQVENQRVRVSMNKTHLCVRSADNQLVQLENGQYRELPVPDITFSREGTVEEGFSPWTRYYDLSDPRDAEHIKVLREAIKRNPELETNYEFRVRIMGEYEGHGEPWPGYDDQDAEQVIAYYKALPPQHRKPLVEVMQYELSKDAPDNAKVVAIETLDKTQESDIKKHAAAGVKM